MKSSRLSIKATLAACLGWAVALAAGHMAAATDSPVWWVVLLMSLSVAMAATVTRCILIHMPPIAAAYWVARNAPCDHEAPRLPVTAPSATGAKVIPMRVRQLDLSGN